MSVQLVPVFQVNMEALNGTHPEVRAVNHTDNGNHCGGLVGGVITVVVLVLHHKERIAKIERGIDPDAARR